MKVFVFSTLEDIEKRSDVSPLPFQVWDAFEFELRQDLNQSRAKVSPRDSVKVKVRIKAGVNHCGHGFRDLLHAWWSQVVRVMHMWPAVS